eukprot:SAG31_NODE_896_length_11159_cov_6.749186_2_plen_1354_part_00
MLRINDPDGTIKAVVQDIPIPVGVHNSKEVVYTFFYTFESTQPGVKNYPDREESLSITMSGTEIMPNGLQSPYSIDLVELTEDRTEKKITALRSTIESVTFTLSTTSVESTTTAELAYFHLGTRGCMQESANNYDKNAVVDGKCTAGTMDPEAVVAANNWAKDTCEGIDSDGDGVREPKGTCFTVTTGNRVTNNAGIQSSAQYIRIMNEGKSRDWRVYEIKVYDENGAEIDGNAIGASPANLFDDDDNTHISTADRDSNDYITINLGTPREISRIRMRQETVIPRFEGREDCCEEGMEDWDEEDGLAMASVAFSFDATFDDAEISSRKIVDLEHSRSAYTDTISPHGANPGIPGVDLPDVWAGGDQISEAVGLNQIKFDLGSGAASCTGTGQGSGAECAVCRCDDCGNQCDAITVDRPTQCMAIGGPGDCIFNRGSINRVAHTRTAKVMGLDNGAQTLTRSDEKWHELLVEVETDKVEGDCTGEVGSNRPTWWVAYKWFEEYCDFTKCCNEPSAKTYNPSCTADSHDVNECEYEQDAVRVHRIMDRLRLLKDAQTETKRLLKHIANKMRSRSWARANLIAGDKSVLCHAGFERTGSKWFQQSTPCQACAGSTVSPSGLNCTTCPPGCTFVSSAEPCRCPNVVQPICNGNQFAGADGQCHSCPAQSTVAESGDSCNLACLPNSQQVGNVCEPCSAGLVSVSHGDACRACEEDQYISQEGVSLERVPILSCTECPVGQPCPESATGLVAGTSTVRMTGPSGWMPGAGAEIAPVGEECNSSPCSTVDSSASCEEDGAGAYTCTCSDSFTGQNCLNAACGGGTQPAENGCEACSEGKYSPGNNVVCRECPIQGAQPTSDRSRCDVTCDCPETNSTQITITMDEYLSCQTSCDNLCRTSCEAWEDSSALPGCPGAYSQCDNRCANAEVYSNSRCEPCGSIPGGRWVLESPTQCTQCQDGYSRPSSQPTGPASDVCRPIVCALGTTLSINDCIDVDECASRPCANNGTCENGDNRFNCVCSQGFSGPTCEVQFDPCSVEGVCSGSGTCTALTTEDFNCDCDDGYDGAVCDSCSAGFVRDGAACVDDPCEPENPCRATYGSQSLVGGTCRFTTGSMYECRCNDGFSGRICETFDPCAAGHCDDPLTPVGTSVHLMSLAVDCETGSDPTWQANFRADIATLLGIVKGATVSVDRIQILGVQCGSVLLSYVITDGDPPAEELQEAINAMIELSQDMDRAAEAVLPTPTTSTNALLANLPPAVFANLTSALEQSTSTLGRPLLSSATVETFVVPSAGELLETGVQPAAEEEDDFPTWLIIVISVVGVLLLFCLVLFCCNCGPCESLRSSIGVAGARQVKGKDT